MELKDQLPYLDGVEIGGRQARGRGEGERREVGKLDLGEKRERGKAKGRGEPSQFLARPANILHSTTGS